MLKNLNKCTIIMIIFVCCKSDEQKNALKILQTFAEKYFTKQQKLLLTVKDHLSQKQKESEEYQVYESEVKNFFEKKIELIKSKEYEPSPRDKAIAKKFIDRYDNDKPLDYKELRIVLISRYKFSKPKKLSIDSIVNNLLDNDTLDELVSLQLNLSKATLNYLNVMVEK